MALNLGSTITNGLRRVANRNGLLLLLTTTLVGFAWQVAFNSIVVAQLPPDFTDSLGLTVDAPLGVLVGVGIFLFLLLPYISIVAMRTFVAGETDRIPREFLRRRMPWVLANLFVGGIAYSLLVLVGTVFLIVPGIILYVSLLFMSIYIAVDDENFLSAMFDSWSLTRGNWIRLFLLVVVIFLPMMVGLMVFSIGASIAFGANSIVSQTISGLISTPFSIFLLGILAEAFVQLEAEREDEERDELDEEGISRTER